MATYINNEMTNERGQFENTIMPLSKFLYVDPNTYVINMQDIKTTQKKSTPIKNLSDSTQEK